MNSAHLEIQGHLIDSLLLAKVIDCIQLGGYEYVVSDLRIGDRKQDLSSARLRVWAPTPEGLEMLIDQLKVHGVRRIEEGEARFGSVTVAGQPPEGAYVRHLPASQLLHNGHWLPVVGSGADWVIVLAEGGPGLKPSDQLSPGDRVLIGERGLRPTTEGQD